MSKPRLIPIPRRTDQRGVLSFLQTPDHVPFPIARVFWLAAVPGETARGGHAHKSLEQLVIVLAGRVTVTAENAGETIEAQLDAQSPALYAPPSTWLDLWDFSPEAVIMVLASAPYDESDYIREREDFDRLQATMRPATVSSHG